MWFYFYVYIYVYNNLNVEFHDQCMDIKGIFIISAIFLQIFVHKTLLNRIMSNYEYLRNDPYGKRVLTSARACRLLQHIQYSTWYVLDDVKIVENVWVCLIKFREDMLWFVWCDLYVPVSCVNVSMRYWFCDSEFQIVCVWYLFSLIWCGKIIDIVI